jgi:DNA (cytosine-5)-methyltransferase 1
LPRTYTYIDLFAGCGGLSLGLHNAGWKGLFAIEKSPDAFATLEHNLIKKKKHFAWPKWLPQKHHDINEVLRVYSKQLTELRGKIDLVVGGPPCQGFSTAGLRRESDFRNGLIKSYLDFIKEVRPKAIFFENVKGFTLEFKKNKVKGNKGTIKGGAYSEYVVKSLQDMGYDVHGKIVDFSKYGIPQRRNRFILVGVRRETLSNVANSKPKDFFSLILKRRVDFLKQKDLPIKATLSAAISDLLKRHGTVPTPDRKPFMSGLYSKPKSKYQSFLRQAPRRKRPDSHSFVNHTEDVCKKFKYIIENQTPNANLAKQLRKKLKVKKHTVILLGSSTAAPTITTLPDDYVHYCEPRILTVREYARIQSFPDWFEVRGKYTTGGKLRRAEAPRYTQIGNAIPPLFAEQSGIILKQIMAP